MDQCLKAGSLKKQSNTAAAESGRASEPQASTSSSQEFQGTECNVPDTMPLLHSSNVTGAGSMRSKKWKYYESYLSSGFTSNNDVNAPDAQCILCNKVLLNCSMSPAKTTKASSNDSSRMYIQENKFLQVEASDSYKLSKPDHQRCKN
jgi:hypothetical protein